jgi:hypothetical protein
MILKTKRKSRFRNHPPNGIPRLIYVHRSQVREQTTANLGHPARWPWRL